jgi:hypothetical protein
LVSVAPTVILNGRCRVRSSSSRAEIAGGGDHDDALLPQLLDGAVERIRVVVLASFSANDMLTTRMLLCCARLR